MKWSYSKSRIFSRCQKQWYYQSMMAYHGKKDKDRRKVFLLKQLQSIYAWRGSLVDKIIEKEIIPRIIRRQRINENEILRLAEDLIEKQLDFGLRERYKEDGMTKTAGGDAYCAFYDLEYGNELNRDSFNEVRKDIEKSLKYLLRSVLFKQLLEERPYMITQRNLHYKLLNSSVTAMPDLIIFHNHQAPTIIDWKVSIGYADYWRQLAIYAISLSKTNPHKDFPDDKLHRLKDPTKFNLIEYQLLRNETRNYTLEEEDLIEIQEYILDSLIQMERLINGEKYGQFDPTRLETAKSPSTCGWCQFKKVCWREM